MLLELKVTNFAIINSLNVHFSDGLNVLSGETGAGKSVLLKSLALLMGEKAFADTVRTGAEQATIEGSFDLEKRSDICEQLKLLGVETSEDGLIVRRVITAQGKSRVYLNGNLCALNSLRDIVSPLITLAGQAAPLIEMTGQHDNRHLQSKGYHIDVLDHYVGAMPKRQELELRFHRLSEINREVERLESERRTRDQRMDFLIYQRDEIKTLELTPGEEETVQSQSLKLRNSAKLSEFSSMAQATLYGDEDSVLVKLHQVLQRSVELKNFDDSLGARLEPLTQAKTLVEDVVYELREYTRNLSGDPEELNRLEERLNQIRRLQKKFGATVVDILANLAQIEQEIASLESADDTLMQLGQERKELEKELSALAEDLHTRRSNGAVLLGKGVNEELEDLNMKGVTFGISLARLPELCSTGISDIEFTIQSSKKDTPRPLAKVASGGELSRILLSLKRVVGSNESPRTYLFDEVDSGVSGLTAEKVGRKLKAIARGQQVICVTHLPQVAAFADSHFVIDKSASRTGVEMKISVLAKGDRVKEIARLISGERITQTSLDHAKQLLTDSTI